MADPGPSSTDQGARLDLEVVRRTALWDRIPVSDALLLVAARAAFIAANAFGEGAYAATLVLTDSEEMRQLNRTWRGKDAPTNVLSFPAGAPLGAAPDEPTPLGDVVLAGETVREEARLKGISVVDHAAHLVVHGMLHLLGFDHERDGDAARMEALETKALAELGIADPYAEAADAAEVSS